jgi:predicted acylesterase/phospholipase RssA
MTKASDARPHRVRNRPPFECIALVLQGGGALGAYQAGVYQALDEAGLDPDWISGISIGAFNSAIIAGNPPGVRVEKLREFWESVTQPFVDWHPPAAWLAEAEASASLAPQPSDFWTFASNLLPALNFDASQSMGGRARALERHARLFRAAAGDALVLAWQFSAGDELLRLSVHPRMRVQNTAKAL